MVGRTALVAVTVVVSSNGQGRRGGGESEPICHVSGGGHRVVRGTALAGNSRVARRAHGHLRQPEGLQDGVRTRGQGGLPALQHLSGRTIPSPRAGRCVSVQAPNVNRRCIHTVAGVSDVVVNAGRQRDLSCVLVVSAPEMRSGDETSSNLANGIRTLLEARLEAMDHDGRGEQAVELLRWMDGERRGSVFLAVVLPETDGGARMPNRLTGSGCDGGPGRPTSWGRARSPANAAQTVLCRPA